MPEPAPVALVGDLLATQAQGARARRRVLVDAAVRDVEELAEHGPADLGALDPRRAAPPRTSSGELDVPVHRRRREIRPGDVVVLDADGAAVVAAERVEEVLEASRAREEKERVKRAQLQAGALSYDLDGLRARRREP